MAFADKIKISQDPESLRVEAESKREFKRRTGIAYPQTDLEWRELLGIAGFTPQEAREIRTKSPDESEIAAYYSGIGALLTEIYARLESDDEPLEKIEKDILSVLTAAGHRLKTDDVLAALSKAKIIHGDSTVKIYLAKMVKNKKLTSTKKGESRGYGLPEWS